MPALLHFFPFLPRWGHKAAKYLISITLGHFHWDAEHYSWNYLKICRINAIFFGQLLLCCSRWEWELSVVKKVEGRWQKLIPIYSSSWEKGPAAFLLFSPSADKVQFWSGCVNMLEFARDQLPWTSCFQLLTAQGIAAWQICSLSPSISLPSICLWDSHAQFASLWS